MTMMRTTLCATYVSVKQILLLHEETSNKTLNQSAAIPGFARSSPNGKVAKNNSL